VINSFRLKETAMNAVTQTRDAAPQARQEPALWPPVVSLSTRRLSLSRGTLAIEAEMALALPKEIEAQHAEVQLSRYRRAFTLSKELDAEKVSAELNQGVLRVRIPKAEHAQPRRIAINVG
jgi:HSP20 family protein